MFDVSLGIFNWFAEIMSVRVQVLSLGVFSWFQLMAPRSFAKVSILLLDHYTLQGLTVLDISSGIRWEGIGVGRG